MPVLADTHCHLDFESFDGDREEVLDRALQAGVEIVINPGIDLATSRSAVQLAEAHSQVYAAVGIHPNSATEWTTNTLEELRELASHPKVVAIGEIGLDYYRDRAPRELQRLVFRQQLSLAAELGLPVIIHNRQAGVDVIKNLSGWQHDLKAANSQLGNRPGVLHSFSEDAGSAHQAIALNFYIGITGPVTFRNAQELRQVVSELPLERLLVETDSPFLTPHPHRGERNEPAYVRFVAEQIAEIHNLPAEDVAAKTSANASRLFNWREIS